jgi:cytochrome c oxidase subunit 3
MTIAFLVGQYMAWGILRDTGLYAVQSPAAAFFMLLTGIHALHLLGGLLVWARATARAWQGIEVKRIRLSVELCTTYWHFLLLVWYVFFTLLLLT